MRVRSGIDMVSVDRIRKNVANEDGAFMRKCYTEEEISRINASSSSMDKRAESFAACFAAKEAASKALGTGIMTKGLLHEEKKLFCDSPFFEFPSSKN